MKDIILKELNIELNLIQNPDIKNLVIRALNVVPDYFWIIPASSTGKYHPTYSLGQGGLLRHTKACVRIAWELFRNETIQQYTAEEKDLIIAALLLHDTCKLGVPATRYTVTEHPLLVRYVFSSIERNEDEADWSEKILQLIAGHMGQWNTDYKTGKEVLPKPTTRIERFVHMVDYLASRKCLEVNFDAELSNS